MLGNIVNDIIATFPYKCTVCLLAVITAAEFDVLLYSLAFEKCTGCS